MTSNQPDAATTVALRIYAEECANDPTLPPAEIQEILYHDFAATGEAEGLSFAEYLAGVAIGPAHARVFYAGVELEEAKRAEQAQSK